MKSSKKKKVDTENIPTKFWNEYAKLDYFQRREKISFIAKSIVNYDCIGEKKMKEDAIASLLQSYFDDVVEVFKK